MALFDDWCKNSSEKAPSFAVALNCGTGSSLLKALVKAFERLHIVRAAHSGYCGSKYSRRTSLKWNARRFPKTRAYIPWFQCANNSEKAADGVKTGCSFSMPFYRQIESEQNVWGGVFGFAGSGKLGASVNGHAYIVNGEYVFGGFFNRRSRNIL
jgi:hypothetical protein